MQDVLSEVLPVPQFPSEPSDEFFCPLSRRIMNDPVTAMDGYSYDKSSIEAWFLLHPLPFTTSPLTGERLESQMLLPNMNLRAMIITWATSIR
jgi:hypothetical protein